MESMAALIQFPEAGGLSIAGAMLLFGSLIFGLFGNDYFKRSKQEKATIRMQLIAIEDIYEDKKLTDSEIKLMDSILGDYAPENKLKTLTTRGAFGNCMQSKMRDVSSKEDNENFRKIGVKLRDIRMALGLDYSPIGKPIFSSRELHVGQVISVAHISENKPNWIRMILKDIDEAYLYVSKQSPTDKPHFHDGDKVQTKLWHDQDAQYSFNSRIVFHGETDAVWRLIHNESKMKRTQAREYFRMRYEQNVSVGILNASKNEDPQMMKQRKAITNLRGKITSLSAGGCAIVFQQPIARQVFLRIELELPDNEPMALEAKIVATSIISGGRSLIRTRFIASTLEDRDLISKFLRKQQQQELVPETTGKSPE
jgi:c-di-GMP-binding flagellar brake protein YcgR